MFKEVLNHPGAVKPLWYDRAHLLLLPTELCASAGGGPGVARGISEVAAVVVPVVPSVSPSLPKDEDGRGKGGRGNG